MKVHHRCACERARRRAALELLLLTPPVLFWSAVFMAVAGVSPFEGLILTVPDAAQVTVVLAFPLVVLMLGVAGVRRERLSGIDEGATLYRMTLAASAALFAVALAATLTK